MKYHFSKELYSKLVIMKASYSFTDDYYVFLDCDDKEYFVQIEPKDGTNEENLIERFSNELLFQATREMIVDQTKNIRELILGRAFASTIVETNLEKNQTDQLPNNLENPFKDWYDEK